MWWCGRWRLPASLLLLVPAPARLAPEAFIYSAGVLLWRAAPRRALPRRGARV
jgi:hypothetical protein